MIGGRDGGQASVETIALAPIVLVCCLIGLQGLVAGASFVAAGNAAHAGALAGQLGRDPEKAALAASPGWSSSRVDVETRNRRVRVRLQPRTIVPGLSELLVAEADAGYVAR